MERELKAGVIAVALLLVFSMSVVPALSAADVPKSKTGALEVNKDKSALHDQLQKILHKETLTSGDYMEIRKLLEGIVEKKISDENWGETKKYIGAEHGKWLYFEKRKAKGEGNAKGSQALSSIPQILAISSFDYIPIVLQPWVDINGGSGTDDGGNGYNINGANDLLKVYHYDRELSTGYSIEITIVYKDEDHPNPILDSLYDIVRQGQFGRIEDIETFFIHTDGSGNPTEIYFPSVYNGEQTFAVSTPDHLTDISLSGLLHGWAPDLIYTGTLGTTYSVKTTTIKT